MLDVRVRVQEVLELCTDLRALGPREGAPRACASSAARPCSRGVPRNGVIKFTCELAGANSAVSGREDADAGDVNELVRTKLLPQRPTQVYLSLSFLLRSAAALTRASAMYLLKTSGYEALARVRKLPPETTRSGARHCQTRSASASRFAWAQVAGTSGNSMLPRRSVSLTRSRPCWHCTTGCGARHRACQSLPTRPA